MSCWDSLEFNQEFNAQIARAYFGLFLNGEKIALHFTVMGLELLLGVCLALSSYVFQSVVLHGIGYGCVLVCIICRLGGR